MSHSSHDPTSTEHACSQLQEWQQYTARAERDQMQPSYSAFRRSLLLTDDAASLRTHRTVRSQRSILSTTSSTSLRVNLMSLKARRAQEEAQLGAQRSTVRARLRSEMSKLRAEEARLQAEAEEAELRVTVAEMNLRHVQEQAKLMLEASDSARGSVPSVASCPTMPSFPAPPVVGRRNYAASEPANLNHAATQPSFALPVDTRFSVTSDHPGTFGIENQNDLQCCRHPINAGNVPSRQLTPAVVERHRARPVTQPHLYGHAAPHQSAPMTLRHMSPPVRSTEAAVYRPTALQRLPARSTVPPTTRPMAHNLAPTPGSSALTVQSPASYVTEPPGSLLSNGAGTYVYTSIHNNEPRRPPVRLQVVPVVVPAGTSPPVSCYASFDTDASRSVCTRRLLTKLGISGNPETSVITSLGHKSAQNGATVSLTVRGRDMPYSHEVPDVFAVKKIPDVRDYIPAPELTQHYACLSGLDFCLFGWPLFGPDDFLKSQPPELHFTETSSILSPDLPHILTQQNLQDSCIETETKINFVKENGATSVEEILPSNFLTRYSMMEKLQSVNPILAVVSFPQILNFLCSNYSGFN